MIKIKKNKLILLVLVIFLIILGGCSNNKNNNETTKSTTAFDVILLNQDTDQAVTGATISLQSSLDSSINSTGSTDENGRISFVVEKNKQYVINVIKDSYYNIYGHVINISDERKELNLKLVEYNTDGNSFNVDTSDEESLINIGTVQTSINIKDDEVKKELSNEGIDKITVKEADESEVSEAQELLEEEETTLGSYVSFLLANTENKQFRSKSIQASDINLNNFSGFIEASIALDILSLDSANIFPDRYQMIVIIKNSKGTGKFRQPIISTDGNHIYALVPLIYKGELASSITIFLTYKANREQSEENKKITSIDELDSIAVSYGTTVNVINLPAMVSVTRIDGYHGTVPVNWNKENSNPTYNSEKPGDYEFSGELNLSESDNLTNPDSLGPSIIVQVGLPPNDVPLASDDTGVVNEDDTVTIDLLSNDSDPDGDTLSVTHINNCSHGTITDNGDGTVEYSPDADFNGADSFTYDISDGKGGIATGTVNVTVNAVNDAPVLTEIGNKSINEGEELSLSVSASDIEGDELTYSASGDLAENFNSDTLSFSWTAGYDDTGNYSLTINVTDGELTDSKTITISVGDVNRSPEAMDDTGVVNEDDTVTIDLLSNDSDPDGDTLSVTHINNCNHGTITDNGDGTVEYSPDADFNGADSFTYDIGDGNGGVTTGTVSITVNAVNDAPIINTITNVSGGNAEVVEGEELTLEVSASDVDSGETLDYIISGADAGKFTKNGTIFSWTPPIADYSSVNTYNITIEVRDGTDTTTADVVVTVYDRTTAAVKYYLSSDSGYTKPLTRAFKQGTEIIIRTTFSEEIEDFPVMQLAMSGVEAVSAEDMNKEDTYHYKYTYTVPAGDGTQSITFFTGLDINGNGVKSTPTEGGSFIVDNTSPIITSATLKD